jgi:uncharacterized protein (DUF2141 family)
LSSWHDGAQHPLSVRINNIKASQGIIQIAVYESKASFISEEYSIRKSCKANGATSIDFTLKMPYDYYAIKIFHDINKNGKLDTGVLKLPTEPTGFSNNPKRGMNPPKYEEVRFGFSKDLKSIQIDLQ